MGRLLIKDTPLDGVKIIERVKLGDSRGFLSRLFCAEELYKAGWVKPINQINQTFTKDVGTIRGIHFQFPPYAEMKLVTCLHGKVFDVAVDLRKGSPTLLSWFGIELSDENDRSLLIPEGFGHGFQTLCENCELLYYHTAMYNKSSESGLRYDDPEIGISWKLPVSNVSDRDLSHELINKENFGVVL